MAEYVYAPVQLVQPNESVILDASVPCNRGYIHHRDGSGIFTLRGIVNNSCANYARYQVTFNGNIALPAGGTPGEISIALALEGEPLQSSRAIFNAYSVSVYGNVTSTAIINVPKGCCSGLSVRNTSGVPINVQNANVTITRIA